MARAATVLHCIEDIEAPLRDIPAIIHSYTAYLFRRLEECAESTPDEKLTTALLDGRIGFVGVSGEFFCGHALSLKRRARLEHLFFLGYCNDYQQYFPTLEASAEGGYGTDLYVSPVELGAGERIMDRALLHLYQMRGRLQK